MLHHERRPLPKTSLKSGAHGTGSAVDHGAPRPRWFLSRNLQPTRRTAKGIDAGADQRDRSQIWGRIQVGGLKHLPTRAKMRRPKLALFGHDGVVAACPLSGPKQTSAVAVEIFSKCLKTDFAWMPAVGAKRPVIRKQRVTDKARVMSLSV